MNPRIDQYNVKIRMTVTISVAASLLNVSGLSFIFPGYSIPPHFDAGFTFVSDGPGSPLGRMLFALVLTAEEIPFNLGDVC